MKRLLTLLALVAQTLCLASVAFAGKTPAPPQASLVLGGSDAALCHANDTAWTLTKTADVVDSDDDANAVTGDQIEWTVTATRGATSDDELSVVGYVEITNSGVGNATIGNIVVNLQRKVGTKWVSAAANVSDATLGDAAIKANIVAAASQELASAANYDVSGAKGTFYETLEPVIDLSAVVC